MSQPVQLQLAGASHNNQRLFSDHYLDYILPKHWDSLRGEASQVMIQLQSLYAEFTPNANNEAQTEDNWIKPVLRAIGHIFEVQAPLKVPDGTQRPDYIFYGDNTALAMNKNKVVDADNLQPGALAVGDAKSWERPLDKTLRGSILPALCLSCYHYCHPEHDHRVDGMECCKPWPHGGKRLQHLLSAPVQFCAD